jgi:hypothetical protein
VAACPEDAIQFVELEAPGEWFEPWAARVDGNYLEATTAD